MAIRLSDLSPTIALDFFQSRVKKLISDYKENNYEFRKRIKALAPKTGDAKEIIDGINGKCDEIILKMVRLTNRVDELHNKKMNKIVSIIYMINQEVEEVKSAEFVLRCYSEAIVDINKYSRELAIVGDTL